MTAIERIEHWGDSHHPAWLDIVRIGLGLLLFMKGVSFIGDTSQLQVLVEGLHFNAWTFVAVHYIAFAHLVGGLLISLGCLTRLASAFQVPILVGAVFLTNIRNGFHFVNSELWLSLIVLALLCLFWLIGSGKFSFDEYVKNHPAYKMK
jgi:putative oxidoreductase